METLLEKIEPLGSPERLKRRRSKELGNEQVFVLLQRLGKRDEAALRELYSAYSRTIYAFALQRLRDAAEAEEIVVDTMHEVWRHPERFRGEAKFSTWLLGIARFKLLSLIRSREPQHEDIVDLEETLESGEEGTFEILAQKQRREAVRQCMDKLPAEQRKARMEGLWIKCDGCGEIIYKQDVEKNLEVCPKCDEHFPLPVRKRLELVLDAGSFAEHDIGLESTDPLQFSDSKRYRERIKASQKSANEGEAFISGIGRIAGREVSIGAFHFGFMGGSMGSVVGEKVTRVFERATDRRLPAIIFSASGGARMQEAIFSLMQMAKSSAALARFRHVQKPYISVLLDPTTGGVAASFAFLGDVILAEPRALIGFAGPRVIEQTIRQKLPEGFQTSEFLLKHGMVDAIVHRKEMREKLSQLLGLLA